MQSKFKVGDKVKIKKGSKYANQSSLIGVIKFITYASTTEGIWHSVTFPDNRNNYRDEDLEFANNKEQVKHFGIVDFCIKNYK